MRFSRVLLLNMVVVVLAACGGGGGGGGSTAQAPDTAAPTVAISAPANGVAVSGTTAITAAASDDVGVSRVEFYLDGALQGADSTAPYSFSWDTSTLARGNYNWTARAYDAANNMQQSAAVSVTVPVYVFASTVVNGATAVATVSLAGLPVPAAYGLNFVVSMPSGASIASVGTSGPYAANGLASKAGASSIILASSMIASGEIMTVNFADVPAGALPAHFVVSLSAVFDGGGNPIQ